MPEALVLSQFLRQRSQMLRQPSPWLTFYEVATPSGTPLRYVDFADPDARGTLPKKVPFNGVEWDSVLIDRGQIEESQEGAAATLPLTVLDPLRQAAYYLRQHNWLIGQKATIKLIPYDDLANPADAYTFDATVVNGRIHEGPSTVTLYLGQWNIYSDRFPWLYYSRAYCQNHYPLRFVVGNACNYPSNEFSEQTRQDYVAGAVYPVKARKFGWSTQMALKCSKFDANISDGGRLWMESSQSQLGWLDERRYGPNLFRVLDGDFDVYTAITLGLPTSRKQWYAGILIQDETAAAPVFDPGEPPPPAPTSSWLFWGPHDDGAGSSKLLRRTTTASASSDTVVLTTERRIRVERVGSTWNFYGRSDETSAWVLRSTTTFTLPSKVRIGLFLGADEVAALSFQAKFDYIRFQAGGLPSCDFSEKGANGCAAHENLHQHNGFKEIPSDRVRA